MSDYNRYFMFSTDHYNKILSIEKKSGNQYKSGMVLVAGNYKKFTSIVLDPEKYSKLYPDAKVVTCGDIRKIKYTEPND